MARAARRACAPHDSDGGPWAVTLPDWAGPCAYHTLRRDRRGHIVLCDHPHDREERAYAQFTTGLTVYPVFDGQRGIRAASYCELVRTMLRNRNSDWFRQNGLPLDRVLQREEELHHARLLARAGAYPMNRRGRRFNQRLFSTRNLHDLLRSGAWGGAHMALHKADLAAWRTTYAFPVSPNARHTRRITARHVTIGGQEGSAMAGPTDYGDRTEWCLSVHLPHDWAETVYDRGLAVLPDTSGTQCFVVQRLGGDRVRAGRPHDTGQVCTDTATIRDGVLYWSL